jgi:uncharacterized protein (TIGR02001 family)
VTFVALACGAGGGRAADGLSGSLGVTTDYVHRGVSQSAGHAAVQGSLVYWHPTGLYAGAWGSTLHAATPYAYPATVGSRTADVEVDLFAGFGKPVGTDWTMDLKAVAYLYPNDPAPVNYDYLEIAVGAAWRQRLVDRPGNLRRHGFLGLQPLGKHIDGAGDLGKA